MPVQHTYTFPPAMGCPFKTITLKELSVQEEIWAVERAGASQAKMVIESITAAIVSVDGTAVGTSDNSAADAYAAMPYPARQLVQAAFQAIHGASEADKETFLKSASASVA